MPANCLHLLSPRRWVVVSCSGVVGGDSDHSPSLLSPSLPSLGVCAAAHCLVFPWLASAHLQHLVEQCCYCCAACFLSGTDRCCVAWLPLLHTALFYFHLIFDHYYIHTPAHIFLPMCFLWWSGSVPVPSCLASRAVVIQGTVRLLHILPVAAYLPTSSYYLHAYHLSYALPDQSSLCLCLPVSGCLPACPLLEQLSPSW